MADDKGNEGSFWRGWWTCFVLMFVVNIIVVVALDTVWKYPRERRRAIEAYIRGERACEVVELPNGDTKYIHYKVEP